MTENAVAAASTLAVPNERTLVLPDGRTLAYCCGGNERSTKVALTLHGVFGVGAIEEHVSRTFAAWMGPFEPCSSRNARLSICV
jgi:hypothetical protein